MPLTDLPRRSTTSCEAAGGLRRAARAQAAARGGGRWPRVGRWETLEPPHPRASAQVVSLAAPGCCSDADAPLRACTLLTRRHEPVGRARGVRSRGGRSGQRRRAYAVASQCVPFSATAPRLAAAPAFARYHGRVCCWLSHRAWRPGGQVTYCPSPTHTCPRALQAILGGSGGGKTTLLDVIARRKNVGTLGGCVRIDGVLPHAAHSRSVAYCMQDEAVSPSVLLGAAGWAGRLGGTV